MILDHSFRKAPHNKPTVRRNPQCTTPTVQLLEHTNLLLQEFDLYTLLLVQPAGQGEDQHLHWYRRHGGQCSVPKC